MVAGRQGSEVPCLPIEAIYRGGRQVASKKKIRSLRVDPVLDRRIAAYAQARGVKDSEAVRDLLEKGLACEGLTLFATPVGQLIREVVEAEFALMREEMDERGGRLEDRVARVCSRGTKASLQTAAMLNDVSRAIIPAWKEASAEELWAFYAKQGGELQSGRAYGDVRNGS